MHKRSTLFTLAALLFAGTALAQAPNFPERPIRVVVPFAPGNTLDNALRQVAEEFKKNTGQAIVVDNKPGGAGIIAAQYVMQAAPDGYTLLLSNTSLMTINPYTFDKLPYDPEKSYKPVTGFWGVTGPGRECGQCTGQQRQGIRGLGQNPKRWGLLCLIHRRQLLAFCWGDHEPTHRPEHGACAL